MIHALEKLAIMFFYLLTPESINNMQKVVWGQPLSITLMAPINSYDPILFPPHRVSPSPPKVLSTSVITTHLSGLPPLLQRAVADFPPIVGTAISQSHPISVRLYELVAMLDASTNSSSLAIARH